MVSSLSLGKKGRKGSLYDIPANLSVQMVQKRTGGQ